MEKSLLSRLMDMVLKTPKVKKTYKVNSFGFNIYENNAIGFIQNDKLVTKFFSYAKTKDGRTIDTRTASIQSVLAESNNLTITYIENDLKLIQDITVNDNENFFIIKVIISSLNSEVIESNYIRPLDFQYPDQECNELFLSLDQKMILTPYDNDMWVRYESVPLRPGRTSYEVTCIYNENTLNGMLIGAIDFDNFKNAIKCSDHDARCYYALSGIADEGTHDIHPHGYIKGENVESSRFICGFFNDIRDALEIYGEKAMEDKQKLYWNEGTPFG